MKLTIFICVLCFTSCTRYVDGKLSNEEIFNCKEKILLSGDNDSYIKLLLNYSCESNYYELIPFSMLMADKYNNLYANKEMYYSTIKLYNNGNYNIRFITNLNELDKQKVITYLIKSAKLGDSSCEKILKEHYSNDKFIINDDTIIIKVNSKELSELKPIKINKDKLIATPLKNSFSK